MEMDNFISHLNALESQSTTEKAHLEELRRTNAMKQEVVANMKKELARYNEFEQERKQKLENVGKQRTSLMNKVATNLSRIKALSTEAENLRLECASQAANKDEVREKLNALRKQMSKIGDIEKKLRSDIHDLKQPMETVVPSIITDMRSKEATIRKALSDRIAIFDLTELVAEVQAIECLRKKRLEISKELTAKSEILSNLDTDNEAMVAEVQKLQIQVSILQEQKEKVMKQREDNDRRLNDLALQKADISRTVESTMCELDKIRCHTTIQKQKQIEIDNSLSSAILTLEGKKTELLSKEEDIKTLMRRCETEKAQMEADLEDMTNGFQQQIEILSKQRKSCGKDTEDVKAEIEKISSCEHFLVMYEEQCRKITETQEKLSYLKESHGNLIRRSVEKKEKVAQKKTNFESLHQDVETKKREVDKNIEDIKAKFEKCDGDIMKEEAKAEDLKNKNFEIEGEIHLVKHQLSTKADELRTAKLSFQENFSQAREDRSKESTQGKMKSKQNFNEGQELLRRGQESAKKIGSRREKLEERRFTTEEEKPHRRIARKQKEKTGEYLSKDRLPRDCRRASRIEGVDKKSEINKNKEGKDSNTVHQLVKEPCPKNAKSVEVEVEQSTSLQHTTTLASMLADDFKRVIAVDMDDSVVKEDDGGDLFGSIEKNVHNESYRRKIRVRNKTLEMDEVEKPIEEEDNTIHFEPSELFTSTPRIVKKQFRPNRGEPSTKKNLSPSLKTPLSMPLFKTKPGTRANEATRGRPRGRGRKKL